MMCGASWRDLGRRRDCGSEGGAWLFGTEFEERLMGRLWDTHEILWGPCLCLVERDLDVLFMRTSEPLPA